MRKGDKIISIVMGICMLAICVGNYYHKFLLADRSLMVGAIAFALLGSLTLGIEALVNVMWFTQKGVSKTEKEKKQLKFSFIMLMFVVPSVIFTVIAVCF